MVSADPWPLEIPTMRPGERSGGQYTRLWGWAEDVGGGIVGYGHGPHAASSVRRSGTSTVAVAVVLTVRPHSGHPSSVHRASNEVSASYGDHTQETTVEVLPAPP